MAYTVHRQCVCGRKYRHSSDHADPGSCPVCWDTADLTDAEAALEDEGKDDS